MNKMLSPRKHSCPGIETILAAKGLDGNGGYWQERLTELGRDDVQRALSEPTGVYSFEKLLALICPAAEDYLEQMAQLAHGLTVQRFGRTIRLYAPLYLSNYCVNSCRYCGFNRDSDFGRTRLSIDQAFEEAEVIASEGFRDILLVSSEDREYISADYLAKLAGKLRSRFGSISMEVYQMSEQEYAQVFAAGIEGVTLYQETYDRQAYAYYHPAGPKLDFADRLDAPNRMAAAGMRKIGLGVLLGLTDWRVETLALAEHAHYLMKLFWQSRVSFSFPRLRPAHEVSGSQFKHLLTDKNIVQMILALRLCFSDSGLVLSTRERASLRDHLIKLGITKISAGSKTNPGGYSCDEGATEQFQIDDDRSSAQVAKMIVRAGFEPVWKDWDRAFVNQD
jgi:2-iminoacetate synthase